MANYNAGRRVRFTTPSFDYSNPSSFDRTTDNNRIQGTHPFPGNPTIVLTGGDDSVRAYIEGVIPTSRRGQTGSFRINVNRQWIDDRTRTIPGTPPTPPTPPRTIPGTPGTPGRWVEEEVCEDVQVGQDCETRVIGQNCVDRVTGEICENVKVGEDCETKTTGKVSSGEGRGGLSRQDCVNGVQRYQNMCRCMLESVFLSPNANWRCRGAVERLPGVQSMKERAQIDTRSAAKTRPTRTAPTASSVNAETRPRPSARTLPSASAPRAWNAGAAPSAGTSPARRAHRHVLSPENSRQAGNAIAHRAIFGSRTGQKLQLRILMGRESR